MIDLILSVVDTKTMVARTTEATIKAAVDTVVVDMPVATKDLLTLQEQEVIKAATTSTKLQPLVSNHKPNQAFQIQLGIEMTRVVQLLPVNSNTHTETRTELILQQEVQRPLMLLL